MRGTIPGAGRACQARDAPARRARRAGRPHFKLRLFARTTTTYEFTSQLVFDEALTSQVHALSPHSGKGTRNVVNSSDNIYNGLSAAERATLTLQATADGSGGYAGVIKLGVQVG